MKTAFVLGLVAVLLAGCGTQNTVPQTTLTQDRTRQVSASWMLPEAKSEDLLYVANFSNVLIYEYPDLKLVGTINGFDANAGECVDSKGNVFVTNFKPPAIYEYPHGGTKRIGKYLLKYGAYDCAFNPVNGNIAITATGGVYIFKPGMTEPVLFKDDNVFYMESCAYDDKGNLYVDGLKTASKEQAILSELPSGRHTFLELKTNAGFDGESVVRWDDGYIDVVAYPKRKTQNPYLVRFSIKGVRGVEAGTVSLDKTYLVNHFSIHHDTLILSDWSQGISPTAIMLFHYPKGGAPTRTFTRHHLTMPRGVVVSLALGR